MSKQALVTGADGFIGSHLVQLLLAHGYTVRALAQYNSFNNWGWLEDVPANDRLEIICGDVRDPKFCREACHGIDTVFHLAALIAIPYSYVAPDSYVDTNIRGTLNMCQAARQENVKRILVTSTSEVYGDPEVHPQVESYWGHVNCNGIRSCYDEGKRCAETLFFDYWRQYQVKIKVIRIFNTYGPRMHPNDGRVVSNFIVQALKGQDITLYGDGNQTRSFCYVDDLIEGMIRLMNTSDEVTGPINVGNPGEFTIRELAEQVIDLTGSKSKLVFQPLPQDDPRQRRPDISLAKKVLDWEPTIPLREGLKKTIAYFEQLLRDGRC